MDVSGSNIDKVFDLEANFDIGIVHVTKSVIAYQSLIQTIKL